MAKFDGILLATDWDGTFFRNKLFDNNIEALKYFEANGGKFTVCSGRYSDFLRGFSTDVPFNTYTICYNGAYIVDLKTNEVLHEGFCDENLFNIIDSIINEGVEYDTVNIYDTEHKEPTQYTYEEYILAKDELKSRKIYKALLRAANSDIGSQGAILANTLELYDYIAVRSWSLSLELIRRNNSKGEALRRVADKIGSRFIVAVGDYENDIEMLKACDLSYAVDNAIDEVKAIADRVTVDVESGAIAAIIRDLERDIDSGIIKL